MRGFYCKIAVLCISLLYNSRVFSAIPYANIIYGRPSAQYSQVQNIQQTLPQNPVVNYDLDPVINDNVYSSVNGFSSPIKYPLNNAYKLHTDVANNNTGFFGTEFFLSLGYSMNKFIGEGLTGKSNDVALNNESLGMGNSKTLTAGFGLMNNRRYGLEINYSYLSGLGYDSTSFSHNQFCGPGNEEFSDDCDDENDVSGGGISSGALMLNLHIPFEDLIKNTFFDGVANPYITGGVGIAFNSISDYEVYDDFSSGEMPRDASGEPYKNNEDMIGKYDKDGVIKHFGNSSSSIAYTFGAGFTFPLDKKTMLDVYYKYSQHGGISSKSKVYYSYDEVEILNPTANLNTGTYNGQTIQSYCTPNAINEGFEYNPETQWCERIEGKTEGYDDRASESGNIVNTELGVKLRLIF